MPPYLVGAFGWVSIQIDVEGKMAAEPLTLILPIKPGEEAPLRQVLDEINADLAGNLYLQLPQSLTTHFLRLAIITDPDHGPRLLLSGNHDGSLADYVKELITIGPGLDEIFNKCVGYSGQANLLGFLQQHALKAQMVTIAFEDETVGSIRTKIAIRQRLETLLDNQTNIDQVFDDLELQGLVKQLPSEPSPWWQSLGLGWFVNQIQAFLLTILRFIGHILGKPDRSRQVSEYSGVQVDLEKTRILATSEDISGPNHLHLVSTLKAGRLLRLKIVLFLTNFASRKLFEPGELSDIRSIHFAHWVIFDQGKRLLFITHYDDSFESYLDDFANRASEGLNSIWNNVEGYPEAAATDVVGFKQFFRNDQQLPSQVFYRAYPDITVRNIIRDRTISKLLRQDNPQAAEQLLALL